MMRLTTTLSGGMSRGAMPTHRLWNIGGWQTLRGLQAGRLRGDAFWMSRAELLYARRLNCRATTGGDESGAHVNHEHFRGERIGCATLYDHDMRGMDLGDAHPPCTRALAGGDARTQKTEVHRISVRAAHFT